MIELFCTMIVVTIIVSVGKRKHMISLNNTLSDVIYTALRKDMQGT